MNREKLKHCILYFLEHINNVHLGRTKLMKLLYYVDFDHYERWERSVTGAVYRKLAHGPVPAEAQKIIDYMVKRGELSECSVKRGQYEQHRLVTASAEFDARLFTGDEMETLEQVAKTWEHATAAEIEAASHNEAPWLATEARAVIDYDLACARSPEPLHPAEAKLLKSKEFAGYVKSIK
jgi:uncharacterized phage-associated protein